MAGVKTKQQEPRQIVTKLLTQGSTVVNLLGTTGVQKPPGHRTGSWISYWEKHSGDRKSCCSAQGCLRTDRLAGGHVKVASGPTTAALFHTRWYIIPVCPEHNRGSSCKTFQVRQVFAVEAPPTTAERIISWKADATKLLRAMTGKR